MKVVCCNVEVFQAQNNNVKFIMTKALEVKVLCKHGFVKGAGYSATTQLYCQFVPVTTHGRQLFGLNNP